MPSQASSISANDRPNPATPVEARRRTGQVAGRGQQLGQHGDEQGSGREGQHEGRQIVAPAVEEGVDGERDQAAQHEQRQPQQRDGPGQQAPLAQLLGPGVGRRRPAQEDGHDDGGADPVPGQQAADDDDRLAADVEGGRAEEAGAGHGRIDRTPGVAADHVRDDGAGGESEGGPAGTGGQRTGLLDELVGHGAEQGAGAEAEHEADPATGERAVEGEQPAEDERRAGHHPPDRRGQHVGSVRAGVVQSRHDQRKPQVTVVTGANSGIGTGHGDPPGPPRPRRLRDGPGDVARRDKLQAMAAEAGVEVRLVELDVAEDESVRAGSPASSTRWVGSTTS